jgi:NSS family neurotransmitter:Na+ symporter
MLAMIGVAVGLGNFWRFPYLVGRFGGAAFVLFYLVVVLAIGVPGLAAEWALGRHTRRGALGAFERARLPFGRALGWFLFCMVIASNAYYSAAVGWVLAHTSAAALAIFGVSFNAGAVLPPAQGFDARSYGLQFLFTGLVVSASAWILIRGLRGGIEKVSRLLVPALYVVLLALIVRGLTLPGAGAGLHWYLLKFQWSDLTGAVMIAALGQVMFSLALGGTFMVVYGSYLSDRENLPRASLITASADTAAGLLAGLAIFPAVFALGLEPASGPTLIFETLPRVFAAMPAGSVIALAFFGGLFFAALLSAMAALEVAVAGLTDNTRLERTHATLLVCSAVLALSLPPTLNQRIFVPWDLAFGSGMQTFGALMAAVAFGWALDRGHALAALARYDGDPLARFLHIWIRFVLPGGILLVFVWWLLSDVLKVAGTAV